jgi:hypothetical protein
VIVHWAEDGEVNQQRIYQVIVHWVLSLGIYSAG